MWTAPGYQPDRPTPPQENGRRLATFPRGEGAEMRVNLAEYQGRPFVSLRLWERDGAGAWWPVKGKGCSVRLNEEAGADRGARGGDGGGRQGNSRAEATPGPATTSPGTSTRADPSDRRSTRASCQSRGPV